MSDLGMSPVEGAPDTSSTPESTPAAEPWAPVMDRVGELASTVGELQSGFQSFVQAQQPPPEPETNWWDQVQPQANPEQYYDQFGNPVEMQGQQQQAGLNLEALQQAQQQMIQQATAPLQQKMQEMQWAADRAQLHSEIPQLADPAVAAQTAQGFSAFLQQSGAPPQVAQWLVNSPQAIGQFFKAAEAEKLAKGQAPASEQVPSLEAAGGAVPGGNGEQPNIVHQVHATRHAKPKGFYG